MTSTPEEDLLEWLERLEVPVEDTATISRFQRYLEDQIEVTDRRLEALWDSIETKYGELMPMGATLVTVEYPWGSEIRFGLTRGAWLEPEKWRPGLWGWEQMKELTGWEE